jgi:hypothetical protein
MSEGRFIVNIGWLQDSGYKRVVLTDDAKRQVLDAIDGSLLHACADGGALLGRVSVNKGTVYVDACEGADLLAQRPALSIQASARTVLEGATLVSTVHGASLFVTDDENGGSFVREGAEVRTNANIT